MSDATAAPAQSTDELMRNNENTGTERVQA
jgi:hypothetical protein